MDLIGICVRTAHQLCSIFLDRLLYLILGTIEGKNNYFDVRSIALSKDFKRFKSKLKAFLLEHTCYSLEEFYEITSKST